METILLQEGDEATLEMITAALQMEGYRVGGLTDTNGNLIEMLSRHRPGLILLDCWRQYDTSQRMVQWVKANFPAVHVIALSCDQRIGEEYRKLGFDDYLVKPFDLDALYQVVSANLSARPKRKPEAPLPYRSANPKRSGTAIKDYSNKTAG